MYKELTVKQLIKKLEKVEDQNRVVFLEGYDASGYSVGDWWGKFGSFLKLSIGIEKTGINNKETREIDILRIKVKR